MVSKDPCIRLGMFGSRFFIPDCALSFVRFARRRARRGARGRPGPGHGAAKGLWKRGGPRRSRHAARASRARGASREAPRRARRARAPTRPSPDTRWRGRGNRRQARRAHCSASSFWFIYYIFVGRLDTTRTLGSRARGRWRRGRGPTPTHTPPHRAQPPTLAVAHRHATVGTHMDTTCRGKDDGRSQNVQRSPTRATHVR